MGLENLLIRKQYDKQAFYPWHPADVLSMDYGTRKD